MMNSKTIIALLALAAVGDSLPVNTTIVEGDLLVEVSAPGKVARSSRMWHWTGGVMPYSFEPGYPNQWRNNVVVAMRYLQSVSCIRFVPRTTHRDYVQFVNGTGCWSYAGRRDNMQQLSLAAGCQSQETIVHEILHALGFWHEHTRPDRDQYIRINWANIKPSPKTSANFGVQNRDKVVVSRPFDFLSRMLYNPTAFSANGRPTIESRIPGKRVLHASQKPKPMSEGDKKMLNDLYRC